MKFSFRKLTHIKKRVIARITGRSNVHYLHIRKTGGTVVKHVLSQSLVTPSCVLHLHPHRIGLKDIPKGHRFFFAVRDPVARFTSGFVSRLRQSQPATFVPWTPEEEKAFRRFQTPDQLARALTKTHADYCHARDAMSAITHLNCSQWDWVGDEGSLRERSADLLWICTQETLTEDFEILKEKLDLPAALRLPESGSVVNATRASDALRVISDEGVDNIKKWYQKDYDLIQFCFEWRQRQF